MKRKLIKFYPITQNIEFEGNIYPAKIFDRYLVGDNTYFINGEQYERTVVVSGNSTPNTAFKNTNRTTLNSSVNKDNSCSIESNEKQANNTISDSHNEATRSPKSPIDNTISPPTVKSKFLSELLG